MQKFGWQVGVTYHSKRPHGLDYEYFINLLNEMEENNMNLLSLMMLSYGYFDPTHDGYCWPVSNPKLKCYQDTEALNSSTDTEFLSKIIIEAEKRNIEVDIMMNWGIWNNKRIITNYPDSIVQQNKKKEAPSWLHCPDSPGAWQLGLDEVEDLIKYYNHPNVKSYSFERISYGGRSNCYCDFTVKKFHDDTQFDLENTNQDQINTWKSKNIGDLIQKYTKIIKSIRPEIKIGLHSQGKKVWGHSPNQFKNWGIDFVLPHTIQFKTSKRSLYSTFDRLAPNPCILHFDGRDTAFTNYPIWEKTPKIIRKVLGWIKKYKENHITGILFFNEPGVSKRNRKEIYSNIQDMISN
jgi:glycosyl hydrolase family 10